MTFRPSLSSWLIQPCLFTIIFMLALHPEVTFAGIEHTCSVDSRPHPAGICGAPLANVLETLCNSFSQMMFANYPHKRSIADFQSPLDDNQIAKRSISERSYDNRLQGLLLSKKDAFKYLDKRQSQGTIICECCFNSCSIRELLQYCSYPTDR